MMGILLTAALLACQVASDSVPSLAADPEPLPGLSVGGPAFAGFAFVRRPFPEGKWGVDESPLKVSFLSPEGPDDALGLALRSLLVPGWGQRTSGRGHWWVFTGIDVLAWSGFVLQRREGARHRTAYRDLAWEVARVPIWTGARKDGPWSYYELMGRWAASGQFDLRPEDEALHPETNEETFNGTIWGLARELHLPAGSREVDVGDPAYQEALAYYRGRAVPPDLQWDWQGGEGSRTRFRDLVRDSDEAFRLGTNFVGLALVNRFISGAEVWIAAHPGLMSSIPVTVRPRLGLGPQAERWQLNVRIQSRTSLTSPPRP